MGVVTYYFSEKESSFFCDFDPQDTTKPKNESTGSYSSLPTIFTRYSLSERKFETIAEFLDSRYTVVYNSTGGMVYSTSWYKNDLQLLHLSTKEVQRIKIPGNPIFVREFDNDSVLVTTKNNRRHIFDNSLLCEKAVVVGVDSFDRIGSTSVFAARKFSSNKFYKFFCVDPNYSVTELADYAPFPRLRSFGDDCFIFEEGRKMKIVKVPSFTAEEYFALDQYLPKGTKATVKRLNQEFFAICPWIGDDGSSFSDVVVVNVDTLKVANRFSFCDQTKTLKYWQTLNGTVISGNRIITSSVVVDFLSNDVRKIHFADDLRVRMGLEPNI